MKQKYDKQEKVMGDMRRNFYKELQHLRDLLVVWKKKEDIVDNYLDVHSFQRVTVLMNKCAKFLIPAFRDLRINSSINFISSLKQTSISQPR